MLGMVVDCADIARYLAGQDHGVDLVVFALLHIWLHIRYASLLWLRQACMWHLVSPTHRQALQRVVTLPSAVILTAIVPSNYGTLTAFSSK